MVDKAPWYVYLGALIIERSLMGLMKKIQAWLKKHRKEKTVKAVGYVPSAIEKKLIETKTLPLRERIIAVIEQDEKKLRCVCNPIDETYTEEQLSRIISDLSIVAHTFKDNCLGVSANQIGHPVKICAIKDTKKDVFFFLINARIVGKSGGRQSHKEYCLSRIGKKPAVTKRWKEIWIEYYDPLQKETHRKWFRNRLISQTIQHEIDHGNGILV